MADFAVIENGTVINTIVADSVEIAEALTGTSCVAYTEESPLSVNWYWDSTFSAYIPPRPYDSWTYNNMARTWEAPTPMPEAEEGKSFNWDEATQSWISFDLISGE